jgi:hypothetical protein
MRQREFAINANDIQPTKEQGFIWNGKPVLIMEQKKATVRVCYDPKPIPDRQFDWTAVDADYEPGDPIGFGETEAEALADLAEQLEEREQ